MSTANLRRENIYVDPSAATTRTVEFTETTPLDNTHLLIALVNVSTSTALTAPTGWSEITGTGGANGNNQNRYYWRRGDGTTNGITVASASAIATVAIAAFAGYNGMTPILTGGNNGTNGNNFPFSGVSGQTGQGVTIFGIGLATAPSSWTGWTTGQPLPSAAKQPATARAWWALADYNNSSADTTVSWAGSRSQRYSVAVIPLTPVAASTTGTATSQLPSVAQAAAGTVGTAGTTPPVTTDSYGPNGGHWPDNTPRPSETFGYTANVAASWTEIANAMNDANTAANQGKTARILVAPGNLAGNGAGATATPMLQSIGMVDRPGGRILVIPRDGVGTVNATASSVRLLDVRGASFLGFNTWGFGQAQVDGGGILLSGCKDFAWGWSKARFWNIGNRSDVITDRVQFVEMVANESFLYPQPDANGNGSGAADRIQWYNSTSGGSGASGQADKIDVLGCFMAPVRVWTGDGAHLDGLQIYGTGAFTNVVMKDTVMYAASDQGFIVNETATVTLDHTIIVGGDAANDTQFPKEANAVSPGNAGAPWPTNGAPASGVARNGTRLFGTPKGWPTSYDSTSGAEGRTSLEQLNAWCPVPTDARLQAMWNLSSTPGAPTGSASSKIPSVTQAASGTVSGTTPTAPVGSVPPVRTEMPADPFDLHPAPSYSWITGPAPSGAGFISVDPSNAIIRLVGPAAKGIQAGSVSGFVNPAPLQDISGAGTGTNPLVFPPYGIRVRTDATEIWFRLGQRSYAGFSNVSARAATRLKVNGKWTSLTPVYLGANLGMPANPDNITAGEYALKLTFPTAEMRDLELTTHLEFGGVVVPDGANGQTPAPIQHTLVVFDGSLTGAEKHQTGNFSLTGGAAGTYTAVSSHIWYAAQILGYDNVINGATGSSGYSISGDTVSIKSSNKIPRDGHDHNPALYLVGGPNNDLGAGQSVAQIEAALDLILPSINSGAPATAIKVIEGAFTAPAMGSQSSAEASVAAVNTAIKAKAQANGFWFINPATGQTYDPQGTLRKTTSNWVYQDTSSISSDNVHPTQDGARKLGIMLADAIVMAHAAGAPAAVSGSVVSTIPGVAQAAAGTVDTPAITGAVTSTIPGVAQEASAVVTALPADGSGVVTSVLTGVVQAAQGTVTAPTGVRTRLDADRGALTWTQKNRGARSRKVTYRGRDTKISTW